jgi:preprotein translocase subunit SecG
MTGTGAVSRVPCLDRDTPMQTVLIVIHLMVVTAMIGAVLLQRSEGGGLGVGGGGGGFMTSRGTANVLTRATAGLALVFFITSMALSIVAGLDRAPRSILGTDGPQAPAPGAPAQPGGGGGVLDQLQAPPPGPAQVPRSQ